MVMETRALDAFINTAGAAAVNVMSAIFGNDQVKEVADKIATFVNYNWELLFTCVSVLSFIFGPLSFVAGVAIGLWMYDKTFTMNPGNRRFSPADLFGNPKHELACLIVTVTTRFLLGGSISSCAVGFLTGCYVRKLTAPAAERAAT